MTQIKIVFFGTPSFSVPALEALSSDPRFDVRAVVTEPEKRKGRGLHEVAHSPVFEVAQKNNIPALTPTSIKKDEEIQKKINSFGADIYVVIAYGKIIPEVIFAAPPHGTVNVHYSLLPQLRGPSPVQGALLAGAQTTGVTLMEIDAEMDHGRIISQEETAVTPNDTFVTLAPRLNEIGVRMLLRDLPRFIDGAMEPREQEHEKATYCKMISKEDGHVDWSRPALEIYNRWKAFIVWPGLHSYAGDMRLNFKEVRPHTHVKDGNQVGVLFAYEKKLCVQCGEGVIEIITIQPEGKKAMNGAAFINGHTQLLGSPLA